MEVTTKADSNNITECSRDDKPTVGMFGYSLWSDISCSFCCFTLIPCYVIISHRHHLSLIKQVDKTQPDITCKRHKKTDKCHWIEHCPNGYYCSVTIRWKVPTNKCLWTTTIHQSRSNTINYKWSLSIHPQIHFHQAWIKFGVYEGGRIAGAENDGPTVKKTVMHKICYSMIYLAELQVCTTTHFSIFIRISA